MSSLQLKAKARRRRAEAEQDPYSAENIAGKVVEPWMALGSGMMATPIAGLAGIGAAGTRALGLTETDPADVVRDVSEALTYQPRTAGGRAGTEILTYPFEKMEAGAGYVGERVAEETGMPSVGAAAKTGLLAIPMAIGARGVRAPKIAGTTAEHLANVLPGGTPRRAGKVMADIPAAEQVATALEQARPRQTAGQAAIDVGSREFAALQKLAEKRDPTKYGKIAEAQQSARMRELETIGRTPEELTTAIAERKAATDPLYEAARKGTEPVNTSQILSSVDKLIAENPGNPTLLTELGKIKKGLTDAEGNIRTNANEVSSTIDGLKTAIANKDNAFIVGELTNIKNALIEAIPRYKEAEGVFREMSRPINQMQIGQELIKTIKPKLGTKERAAAFETATIEAPRTIKRATGAPRYKTLEQALTPEQMQTVGKVSAELERNARLSEQATQGRPAMQERVTEALRPTELPPMLSTKMMIARKLMSRMKGKATQNTLDYITARMDNPAEIARIIRSGTPEQKLVANELIKINPAILGGAIGAAENQ